MLDRVNARLVAGIGAAGAGDPASAARLLAASHQDTRAVGNHVVIGMTGVPLARVLIELGRDSEAAELVEELARVVSQRGDHVQVPSLRALLAARAGRFDQALRLSSAAESEATPDLVADLAYVRLDRAEILLAAGRPDEALALAGDALAMFERKEFAAGVRRARAVLAGLGASGEAGGPTAS